MGFNVGDEIFKDMNLPKLLVDANPFNLSISVCGEMITVFQYDNRLKSKRCSVWIMKEYGVVETNGELLMALSDGTLVLYNPKSKGVKKIGICGGRDSYNVGNYVESLVFLDRGAQIDSYDEAMFEEEPNISGEDAAMA
ncbi:unnamed protein product [Ilex paraguariensis]|uniref:F-box protein n=1 Tax=Ilex paraguariensis TaxID=185542 RepID=A0ABC8TPK9_9AQUA